MIRVPLIAIAAVVGWLCAGCGTEPDGPARGAAAGTVSLPVAATAGTAVAGSVTVVLDDFSQTVSVNTTAGVDGTVPVSCSFGDVPCGRKSLVYTGTLTINGVETTVAGYSLVEVERDVTADLSGTIFTRMSVNGAADGLPDVTYLTTDAVNGTTTSLQSMVTGIVARLNVDRAFVYVNGDAFPIIVIPSTATASFSALPILEPGDNTVRALAVNTTGGVDASEEVRVTCTRTKTSRSMCATLLWDTPRGDLDLHLWYYPSANPALVTDPAQHCEFETRSIPAGAVMDAWGDNGQGPEHVTFNDYPDGYYVVAVNAFDLKGETSITATATLSVGAARRTMRHSFTTANLGSYTTGLEAWWRCFDVRVVNGKASVLSPDPAFQAHQ